MFKRLTLSFLLLISASSLAFFEYQDYTAKTNFINTIKNQFSVQEVYAKSASIDFAEFLDENNNPDDLFCRNHLPGTLSKKSCAAICPGGARDCGKVYTFKEDVYPELDDDLDCYGCTSSNSCYDMGLIYDFPDCIGCEMDPLKDCVKAVSIPFSGGLSAPLPKDSDGTQCWDCIAVPDTCNKHFPGSSLKASCTAACKNKKDHKCVWVGNNPDNGFGCYQCKHFPPPISCHDFGAIYQNECNTCPPNLPSCEQTFWVGPGGGLGPVVKDSKGKICYDCYPKPKTCEEQGLKTACPAGEICDPLSAPNGANCCSCRPKPKDCSAWGMQAPECQCADDQILIEKQYTGIDDEGKEKQIDCCLCMDNQCYPDLNAWDCVECEKKGGKCEPITRVRGAPQCYRCVMPKKPTTCADLEKASSCAGVECPPGEHCEMSDSGYGFECAYCMFNDSQPPPEDNCAEHETHKMASCAPCYNASMTCDQIKVSDNPEKYCAKCLPPVDQRCDDGLLYGACASPWCEENLRCFTVGQYCHTCDCEQGRYREPTCNNQCSGDEYCKGIEDCGGYIRDEALEEIDPEASYCGPDITELLLESVTLIQSRVQKLPDTEKGSIDGTMFLKNNGMSIDLRARAWKNSKDQAVCPSEPCKAGDGQKSIMLCGHCVMEHIGNDILYGFIANQLDVPKSIQLAGAHYAEIASYGGLDPLTSQAAYMMGNDMSDAMKKGNISIGDLCSILNKTTLETGLLSDSNAFELMGNEQPFLKDCMKCPYTEVKVVKDFSKGNWTKYGGGSFPYPDEKPYEDCCYECAPLPKTCEEEGFVEKCEAPQECMPVSTLGGNTCCECYYPETPPPPACEDSLEGACRPNPCPEGKVCQQIGENCHHCNPKRISTGCQTDTDCDNGQFCDGAEFCDGGVCRAGDAPCHGENCYEDDDSCGECSTDQECSDSIWCNGEETCQNHNCLGGTSPCKYPENCDEINKICKNTTQPAGCENVPGSSTNETCFGQCTPEQCKGTPVYDIDGTVLVTCYKCEQAKTVTDPCSNLDCDDHDDCTTDSCSNGECVNVPITTGDCADDKPLTCYEKGMIRYDDCTVCFQSGGVCEPSGAGDGCFHCKINENACLKDGYVIGKCNDYACPSTHECISDGDCYICNPKNALCDAPYSSGACVNNPCKDHETCVDQAQNGNLCHRCIYGPEEDGACTDGLKVGRCHGTCTTDQECEDVPGLRGAPCHQCFEKEQIDPCANLDCDDHDDCTTDSCSNGECVHAEIEIGDCAPECTTSADCDDGNFCNGTERCRQKECFEGQAPCDPQTQTCDEDADKCVQKKTEQPSGCENVPGSSTNETCFGQCTPEQCKGTPVYDIDGTVLVTCYKCEQAKTVTDPCATLDCDDHDDCTADSCSNGECVNAPITTGDCAKKGCSDLNPPQMNHAACGSTCPSPGENCKPQGYAENGDRCYKCDFNKTPRCPEGYKYGFCNECSYEDCESVPMLGLGDGICSRCKTQTTGCTSDADCSGGDDCHEAKCAGGVCTLVKIDDPAHCGDCKTSADCDDGQFCNGEELCTLTTGECAAGMPPCTVFQQCDEVNDKCEDIPDCLPGYKVGLCGPECPKGACTTVAGSGGRNVVCSKCNATTTGDDDIIGSLPPGGGGGITTGGGVSLQNPCPGQSAPEGFCGFFCEGTGQGVCVQTGSVQINGRTIGCYECQENLPGCESLGQVCNCNSCDLTTQICAPGYLLKNPTNPNDLFMCKRCINKAGLTETDYKILIREVEFIRYVLAGDSGFGFNGSSVMALADAAKSKAMGLIGGQSISARQLADSLKEGLERGGKYGDNCFDDFEPAEREEVPPQSSEGGQSSGGSSKDGYGNDGTQNLEPTAPQIRCGEFDGEKALAFYDAQGAPIIKVFKEDLKNNPHAIEDALALAQQSTQQFMELKEAGIKGILQKAAQAGIKAAVAKVKDKFKGGEPNIIKPNDPLFEEPEKEKKKKLLGIFGGGDENREPIRIGGVGMRMGTKDLNAPAGSSHKEEIEVKDQWGIQRVGYKPLDDPDSAWNVFDGSSKNVIVAVIDSGLDMTHPDSPEFIWQNAGEIEGNGIDDDGNGYIDDINGWNFLDDNPLLNDYKGHGTFVAGIIAAKRNNGIGIAGINPGAIIMPLKVANADGESSSFNISRAIYYAVNNGARIINISLGAVRTSELENMALKYAHDMGVFVAVASGNVNENIGEHGPASSGHTFAVGAIDISGDRSTVSNHGPNLGLVAPGEQIMSLLSADAAENVLPSIREFGYYPQSGTSFSTPMVAATASLLLAQNPSLTNEQIEDILLQTADDMDDPGWDGMTGAGLLNATKALKHAKSDALTVKITRLADAYDGKRFKGVNVYGTVRGSFKSFVVEIGKGRRAKKFETVAGPFTKEASHSWIAFLDRKEYLRGSNDWIVRITATDKSGNKISAETLLELK